MRKYFVFINNEEKGPLTFEQLKKFSLQSNTLVRYEGQPQWVPAGQLAELSSLVPAGGLPAGKPIRKRSSSTVIDNLANDYSSGPQHNNKRMKFVVLGLITALVAIGFYSYINKQAASPSPVATPTDTASALRGDTIQAKNTNSKPPAEQKAEESQKPLNYLDVRISSEVDEEGRTVIYGKMVNNAVYTTYKYVEIGVQYLRRNGTAIDSETFTDYNKIPPGGSREFRFRTTAPEGTTTVKKEVKDVKFEQ